MKKFLLLSTLLCSAMAMTAQNLESVDLGEMVPVKVSNTLATPIMKPALQYTNSEERIQRTPAVDWNVYTFARGVYSQIPRYSEEYKDVVSYGVEFLYGPVLVDWAWVPVYPTDAVVGEPTFSFLQKALSDKEEDVEMRMSGKAGLTRTFGSSNSVVRITGVNGDGATTSWDRMDIISPMEPSAQATSLMYTPIMSEKVGFSQAYWGNIYGYYTGYSSGEVYGESYANKSGDHVTGVVEIYTAPITPLYIYGGNAIVKTPEGVTNYDASNITFEIWTLNEEGKLEEMIAQATDGTMYGSPTGNSGVGSLEFTFSEYDEVTQLPIDKPVSLPAGKDFAVVLNNVTGSNLNVMMTNDPCGGVGIGGGYLLFQNSPDYMESFWGPDYSFDDIALGLYGYIPGGRFLASSEDGEYLEAPVAGGAASTYDKNYDMVLEGAARFGCSHNFFVEDGFDNEAHVKVNAPEWVEVAVDTTDYSTTGVFYLIANAEPLPGEMSGRDGYIELDVYGFKSKIQIGQGEFTVGVNDAQVAEASARVEGENIVLTYGEGVNAVDVINVAGARVASYALPAGGNFTVPASDYAKGLYILNFKGDKKATVKVVK